jgi:glycosyltransferase involved in cell wall biosynthesis
MVLIEAMRAGVPVIAMHKSGGPEEFISHNVNGFLCSANTLADQIMYAFDNRELLEPIREAAFETVKKDFTHQRVVREFIQVLNSVKEE